MKTKKYLFLSSQLHGNFVRWGSECTITRKDGEIHLVITQRGRDKGKNGYVVSKGCFAEATKINKAILLRYKKLIHKAYEERVKAEKVLKTIKIAY